MFTRRSLFGILGLPAISAIPAGVAHQHRRFVIQKLRWDIPTDCYSGHCPATSEFAAKCQVTDRHTNVTRFFCLACLDEFNRDPVPFEERR